MRFGMSFLRAVLGAVSGFFGATKPALEVTSQLHKQLMTDEYWVMIMEPRSVSPVRIECLERACAYDIAKGTLKEALGSDSGAHNVLVFENMQAYGAGKPPLPSDFRTVTLRPHNSATNPMVIAIKTESFAAEIPFTKEMQVTVKKEDGQKDKQGS